MLREEVILTTGRSLGDRGERCPVVCPDTVSVCKGDIVGAEGSTRLRGASAVKSGATLTEVERRMAPIPPTHRATWRKRRI